MATNRYTDITPSKFSPLSLQELSMVPMMKRQQHDQLLAQQELLKQGLAKVDPLDVHMNEALNVKSQIENKLASQAELLAREGVNSNTQGQFLALNREYQNLISPTGRLGQINAAKQVYAKNFNDYLEDAQKTKGWSRERALTNWYKNHASKEKYTGFDSNNNIVSIDQYGAPKYIDIADRVQNYAKEAGMSSSEFARSSGALTFDKSNNRYVVNSNSKGLTSDNINQLNQVAQTLNRELSNPNSEVRRSIEFDGQDPNRVMQDVISQLGIYRNNKSSREQGYSIGSVDWNDSEVGNGNMELIVNNEVFKPDSLSINTFEDNNKRLNILQSKTNLTPEERVELNGLKDFQSNVNKELNNNKDYQIVKKQQDDFYNKYSKNVQKLLKDPILRSTANFTPSKSKGIYNVQTSSGELLKGGDGKVLNFDEKQMSTFYKDRNKAWDIDKKPLKIQNKVTNENSVKYNGYQLVPITPKDDTSIKLANEAFENALRSNPENLLNLTNIESVDVEDGRREGKDLDLTDKKEIQKLFNGSERGALKIISFIPKGFSGKPEYIVEFNTKEGNSTNLNRYFRSESGSGNLGDGKPVRLKLSYKHTKGDVLNNANGYIQQYLSNKGAINPNTGQPIGRDLALEMKVNADKAILNDELSNSKWSDMITENTDFNKLNPFIVKQLQSELKKYGLNNNTSDDELQTIIKKFIKENSNKNIYLE